MSTLINFPWPKPPSLTIAPHWSGSQFVSGVQACRVLAYAADDSHWSNDLTAFHELEAGHDHPIDLASRAAAVKSMVQLASQEPILLDVGCSSGFVLEDLKKALPKASLIGADYLHGPLEGLAKRIHDIPLLQFDLRQCPLPDCCVDGVTCLNVLEHIDDDNLALSEIYRVLKPGGFVHLEVPAGPELFDIYDEYLLHHRRYRLRTFRDQVKKAGFTVKAATHLGFFLFPGFCYIKYRNRRKMHLSADDKAALVATQIRSTKSSNLLRIMVALESCLGYLFSYPIGIRCIIVARKPVTS
jgi:SAM-dependent methyltransferase